MSKAKYYGLHLEIKNDLRMKNLLLRMGKGMISMLLFNVQFLFILWSSCEAAQGQSFTNMFFYSSLTWLSSKITSQSLTTLLKQVQKHSLFKTN